MHPPKSDVAAALGTRLGCACGWLGPVVLTPHDELPLPADRGGIVAGDAGVVAVVLEGDAGDLQGAHELLALDGDSRAGEDDVPILPPGDVDWHVPGGDHAGDVEELPDGGWWELEGLDQRRDCQRERQSMLESPSGKSLPPAGTGCSGARQRCYPRRKSSPEAKAGFCSHQEHGQGRVEGAAEQRTAEDVSHLAGPPR